MHHYVSLFLKLETLDALTTMTTYHSSNTHDWVWAELNEVENFSAFFIILLSKYPLQSKLIWFLDTF